ncbi:MAG: ABC transporter ATP-binding protein, partial [Spirochaetaceae bacterium]|nr:ABC transporter ATP-binding protein [Spirochaetaceae bacterium]
MIAMALACKPSLLIADEPTTALDVTIQDQILKLLRNLQDEMQMSIIFISHDLGVVAEICSRVMVMYGGMVMEYANIDDVFSDPKHPYTIGLLESIPSIVQDRNVSLIPIPGSPPDMSNPPKGCPFHPRCRYARKICSLEVPPMFSIADDHGSRCWLLDDNAPENNNPFAGGRNA